MSDKEVWQVSWYSVFAVLLLIFGYLWKTGSGPFAPTVMFDFHEHAKIDGEHIVVTHEDSTWTFDSGTLHTGRFRIYGQNRAFSEKPPEGAPFAPITHMLLIEPLKINQRKIANTGHEEDDHFSWLGVPAWPINNKALESIEKFETGKGRVCAEITGRYARVKDYDYPPDPAYKDYEYDMRCTGNHQCARDHIYIIEKFEPIDCHSEA